jgi:plastocyanin
MRFTRTAAVTGGALLSLWMLPAAPDAAPSTAAVPAVSPLLARTLAIVHDATSPGSPPAGAPPAGALVSRPAVISTAAAKFPRALIYVIPARPRAGQRVRLRVWLSGDPAAGTPLRYVWSLARGSQAVTAGGRSLARVFTGTTVVVVRALAGDEVVAAARRVVRVLPARLPAVRAESPRLGQAQAPGFASPGAGAAPRHAQADGKLSASAASAHAVRIIDFGYSPRTITIRGGDTITWTNSGKAPHSATATDHSFDTGLLTTGKSASHTFTNAGTYSYYCVVHPWMTATVFVSSSAEAGTRRASGSGATSSRSSARPAGAGNAGDPVPTARGKATAASAGGGSLPYTGFVALAGALAGLVLTGAGAALRRLAGA